MLDACMCIYMLFGRRSNIHSSSQKWGKAFEAGQPKLVLLSYSVLLALCHTVSSIWVRIYIHEYKHMAGVLILLFFLFIYEQTDRLWDSDFCFHLIVWCICDILRRFAKIPFIPLDTCIHECIWRDICFPLFSFLLFYPTHDYHLIWMKKTLIGTTERRFIIYTVVCWRWRWQRRVFHPFVRISNALCRPLYPHQFATSHQSFGCAQRQTCMNIYPFIYMV